MLEGFVVGKQSICCSLFLFFTISSPICSSFPSLLSPLSFSLLHSTEQASADVAEIPLCWAFARPGVSADVEGRGERREAGLQLPQVGPWMCRGGEEGEGTLEKPWRRDRLREAAREQEGVRHRLDH